MLCPFKLPVMITLESDACCQCEERGGMDGGWSFIGERVTITGALDGGGGGGA